MIFQALLFYLYGCIPLMQAYSPVIVPQPSLPDNCLDVADGLYGKDCLENVTVCMGGFYEKARCPSGLLYSASSQECVPFFSRQECIDGVGTAIDEKSCGEGSGSSSVGVCSSGFVSCIGGKKHRLECPEGLLFSAASSACEAAPFECETFLVSSTTAFPESQNRTRCAYLREGFHPLKCSSDFLNCVQGEDYILSCPEGYYFAEEGPFCLHRRNFTSCELFDKSEEGASWEESSEEGSGEDESSGEGSGQFPEEVEPKKSGNSSQVGPTESFEESSGDGSGEGSAELLSEESGESSGEGSSDSLIKNSGESSEEGSGSSLLDDSEKPAEQGPEKTLSLSDRDAADFCRDRPDGFFAGGLCSTNFVGCSGGVGWRMICPANLFYDEDRQMCNFWSSIAKCSSSPSPPLPSAASPTPGRVTQPDNTTPLPTTPLTPEAGEELLGARECVYGSDGFYSLGRCSNKFIGCAGQRKYLMECPARLVFDETNQMCEYPGNMGCLGEIGEVGTITEPSAPQPAPTTYAPLDPNITPSTIDVATSTLYTASSTPYIAPLTYRERPYIPPSYSYIAPSAPYSAPSTLNKDSSSRLSSSAESSSADLSGIWDCTSLEDGFYATDKCSSTFRGCSKGFAWQMICPADLVFSQQLQMCDYPGNIASCAGRERAGVSQPEPWTLSPPTSWDLVIAPVGNSGSPETPLSNLFASKKDSDASPAAGAASCDGLREGFYSMGCGTEFLGCLSGKAIVLTCPVGLVFREDNQICDFLANVPECSNSLTSEKSVGEPPATAFVAPNKIVDAIEVLDCSEDGFFAVGTCSDRFTRCRGGRALQFFCIDGYLFDEKNRICVPSFQLIQCN